MSKTKKRIVWAIVVLGVLIGGIIYFTKSRKPVTTYTTAEAIKGTLNQTVSVTGDLVANEEITLNFEIGGRVDKVFVKESQKVASGDKIATLTDSTLQKQTEQAKAALAQAVANAGANDDALREAKVAKENAENSLEQTKDLNAQNVEAAKKAVDNAQKYYEDTLDFYNSAPSKQNKLTLTAAENALGSAKQTLKVAEEQASLAKVSAENAVESAKAKIKTVESKFTRAARSASVAQARAAYESTLINLAKATLISPVNGIITEVNNKPGEVLGTGVIKESFSRVMSLDMLIQSQVPESDIVKVKLAQSAKVTFDALTQQDVFDAEVIEIDPASTVVQGVVYYKIKLKLNNVDARIKPGMSANIDIATAEKKDVVTIPMRAIKKEDEKEYVEILLTNNMTRKVYVETGLEGDEGMIEIKSGLKGGEKVVTFVQNK